MSLLNHNTIMELIQLSHIDCTEEEKKILLEELKKIVSYMDQLNDVDTDDVPPYVQPIQETWAREDIVGSLLSQQELLDNAPDHAAGMIRIPSPEQNK